MGHPVSRGHGLQLKVSSPVSARIVLIRDGATLTESKGTSEMAFVPEQPGAYRVEVYRDDLGPPFDRLPWIISNPIYVR